MFNWYKFSQMSTLNSLRLLDLNPDFTQGDLEKAAREKFRKWSDLVGRVPHANDMLERIKDAYDELSYWILDRKGKDTIDFYL